MRSLHIWVVGLTIFGSVACGGLSPKQVRLSAEPMPQGGNFHGVYTSPQYGEMHLCVSGATVVGWFQKHERSGRIQGQIDGNLMRFQWREERELVAGRPTTTQGLGYFMYEIDENGDHYALGEWGHDKSNTGGGPWRNVRWRGNRSPDCARVGFR
ncbi:MAG: hypothetical protein AAF355_13350 [Myxococcota bacterium]